MIDIFGDIVSEARPSEAKSETQYDISHTLYCSSSERMDDLKDESVHMVVTSPPYWDIKDYGPEDQIGHDESLDLYLDRLESVWEECYRVLKPGCRFVVNIGDQYQRATEEKSYHITPLNAHIIDSVLEATDDEILFLGNIIWQKQTNTETSGGACVMGSFGRPRNGYVNYDYEYISIFKKPGSDPDVSSELKNEASIPTEEWKELFNGHWRFTGDRQQEHPAPYPPELPRRLLRMFTFPGDVVLDPFLGRGTTMRVADEMDRSSIGFELGFESPTGQNWLDVIKRYIGYEDYPESRRERHFNVVQNTE